MDGNKAVGVVFESKSGRQAVMAKQFVSQQKASRAFAIPALEGGQPEITAPIARLGSK